MLTITIAKVAFSTMMMFHQGPCYTDNPNITIPAPCHYVTNQDGSVDVYTGADASNDNYNAQEGN